MTTRNESPRRGRGSRCLAVPLAAAILFTAGAALANCVYEGRTYPEGTRIGVFVCEKGNWVRQH